MSFLDSLYETSISDELILAIVEALGLDDSSAGGKFDKTYTSGREYYAGVHFGVCHGPVDKVLAIFFDGKPGWRGVASPGQQTIDGEGYALPEPRNQEDPGDLTNGGAKQLQGADRIDTIVINQEALFGGEPVEGGVLGLVDVLHGGRDQPIHSYLAGKMRYNPNSTKVYTPAYRGVLSLVFHSHIKSFKDYVPKGPWQHSVIGTILAQNRVAKLTEPVTHHTGFYWGAMRPSLRAVSVEGFRALRGWNSNGMTPDTPWYPTLSWAEMPDRPLAVVTRNGKPFMNAAHIIVQCLTDLRSGMKLPIDKIGQSFYDAAIQLMEPVSIVQVVDEEVEVVNEYTDKYGVSHPCEGFGLGLIWSGEGSIREFIQEICRYINASVYMDPSTGKMEIAFIRPVPESAYDQLPIFGPDQIMDIGTFSRPTGEESVNTINVIYSHYHNDKTETVTRSNTAMVSIYDGQVISETLHFLGIKDSELAEIVCEREVRQRCSMAATYSRMRITREAPLSGPLDNPSVNYSRSALTLYEGAPFRLVWPKHGINGQIFRCANLNYGNLDNNYIEFDAVEDVFALVNGSEVGGGNFYDFPDATDPLPAFEVDQYRFIDLPYVTLLAVGGTPLINALPTDSALFGVMADTDSIEVTGFSLFTNLSGDQDPYATVDPALLVGNSQLTPTSALLDDLPILDPNTGLLVTQAKLTGMNRMSEFTAAGAWFIVGDEKILCIDIVTDDEDPDYLTMTLMRGIFDSVPQSHAAGAKMWWFNGNTAARSTSARYSADEPTDPFFMLCPYDLDGSNTLGTPSTTVFQHAVDNAWARPYPPANVKVEGVLLGSKILGEDFTLEWSCRNRIDQSDVPLSWDANGVQPEPGTTYTINVYNADDDTLIHSATDIETFGPTGYFKYTYGRGPGNASAYKVEIFAVRNGLRSAQASIHTITGLQGYGLGYGNNYGGGSVGVRLEFGDPPPVPPVVPAVGTPCPRPVWVAGGWQHLDPAVQEDGGAGYQAEPSEIYDFYSDGISAQFLGPVVTTAAGKPYNAKACCSKGTGTAAKVYATSGEKIFYKPDSMSAWEELAKPSVGLFSDQATVNFISYHQGSDRFTILMNGGADIYTSDNDDLTSPLRKGTAAEANEISDFLQVKWIRRFGTNYVACGVLLADYTKVGIYSSTDLVSWTERNLDAPAAAIDPDNWIWFNPNSKWYVFSTVGDPEGGAVYSFSTTNGWSFTSKSMGAPVNTPVVGHGICYGRNPGRTMEVFAGAYLFSTEDGSTWNKQRTHYAPEQVLAAFHGRLPFEDSDPGETADPLLEKHILLRTGRYLYTAEAPAGHPGVVSQGGVLGLGSLTDPFTSLEVIQPATLPYGSLVGCLGDMSHALSESGFVNGGMASDDVYGFIGQSAGKRYFEVSVATGGKLILGVAAALGPKEVAPVSSLVMDGSGKIMTDIRLACPGGIKGGDVYRLSSAPNLAQSVVGVFLDLDSLVAQIFVDGEFITQVTGLTAGLFWFPIFSSMATPLRVNLGQSAFLMPPPIGAVAWLS